MNTTVFWAEVPKFLEAAENNRFSSLASFALSKLNIKSLEMSISYSSDFFFITILVASSSFFST